MNSSPPSLGAIRPANQFGDGDCFGGDRHRTAAGGYGQGIWINGKQGAQGVGVAALLQVVADHHT